MKLVRKLDLRKMSIAENSESCGELSLFNNDNVLLLFPFISEQDNCWPFLKCRGPFNAKWASVGGWLIGGVDLALTTNSFWRNKNTGSQCQRLKADDNYKHKK